MYNPALSEPVVRKLYRLGRVRRIPMTKLADQVLAAYLAKHETEIASYDPKTHDARTQARTQRAA